MSKAIQKVSNEVELVSDNIQVVPYGLKFNAELSRDEWINAFQSLQHVGSVYQWYLGDLVAQADWQWKGELYDMMMDATGLEYQTLKHYSNIARTYPADIRKFIYDSVESSLKGTSKIGIAHFKAVAPVMNQDPEKAADLLIRAGREGWTVVALRDEIARSKGKVAREPDEDVVAFKETTKPYFKSVMNLVEVRGYDTEMEFLEELKYAVETRISNLEKEG